MAKYRVECQVVLEVEAGSPDDVIEAVEEELMSIELVAINTIIVVAP